MAFTYNNAFEDELKKLILISITKQTEDLIFGGAIADYAEYKYRIGGIAALKAVIDMCDDVRTELDKR